MERENREGGELVGKAQALLARRVGSVPTLKCTNSAFAFGCLALLQGSGPGETSFGRSLIGKQWRQRFMMPPKVTTSFLDSSTAVGSADTPPPPPRPPFSVFNAPLDGNMYQEERREAVAEMRRLADLSGRKADAMLARRGRREKSRLLRAWRRLRDKRKNRRGRRTEGGEEEGEEARGLRRGGGRTTTSSGSTERDGSSSGGSDEVSGSGSSSDSGTSSSSGSAGSSRSAVGGSSEGDRSSSFASSRSTKEQLEHSADDAFSLSSSSALPRRAFPVPSAADAAEAGRENFAACFRADVLGGRKAKANMAPLLIAAEAVHKAMRGRNSSCRKGVSGAPGLATQELLALARFEWQRKSHEAEITRVVYGAGS